MSDQKYSPGPWKISDYDGYIVDAGRGYVAACYGEDNRETNANADLIAAAPELLEACILTHDMLLTLHRCQCDIDQKTMDEHRGVLRAAIAKAEGRE